MAYISGIGFQHGIEDRIKKDGWQTHAPVSYIDDEERKPRPIDVVATRQDTSFNPRGNQLAIVVECKTLTNTVKVYERDNPRDKKAYFHDGHGSRDFDFFLERVHFFPPNKVVTEIDRGNDLFGAVMQSTKALLYLRTKELLNKKGLFFPLVVYQGGSLVNQDGILLDNITVFLRREWINPETGKIDSRTLYVDVVQEKALEERLKVYKDEMGQLMQLIFFEHRMEENRIEQNRRDRWRNSAL